MNVFHQDVQPRDFVDRPSLERISPQNARLTGLMLSLLWGSFFQDTVWEGLTNQVGLSIKTTHGMPQPLLLNAKLISPHHGYSEQIRWANFRDNGHFYCVSSFDWASP